MLKLSCYNAINMEPNGENQPVAAATPSAPIMDVAPPTAAMANDKPHTPPQNQQSSSESQTTPENDQKPTGPKPIEQPSNGVGLAIFATVIIVLALSMIAAYAYMKTAK